jgi:hypothetical protein
MITLEKAIHKSMTRHSRSVHQPYFLWVLRQELVFSTTQCIMAPSVAGLPFSQIVLVRVWNPELRLSGNLEVVSVIEVDVHCLDTSP